MSFDREKFNDELVSAVERFDHQSAGELSEELVRHLRDWDEGYPLKDAKSALTQLRSRRWFELMQQVADALIQNGQAAPYVRRQFAQSQLDQGNVTAGICALERLEADTAPDGSTPESEEFAEARGLLGRAYKDLYVLADNSGRSKNRRVLRKAIQYYLGIYEDDPEKVWQGINSVALIRRAERDGVQLDDIADLKRKADSMAAEILAKIKHRYHSRKADTWDFATGLEACIGLDLHDKALDWLSLYLRSDWASAFELGSTFRQLTQVWKLGSGSAPGNRILPMLKGELLKKKGSEIEIIVGNAADEHLKELGGDEGLERVFGADGFRSVLWLKKCMERAAAVARIETAFEEPFGSAFVIRGGDLKDEYGDELLLLTNAHVVSSKSSDSRVLRPEKAFLRFEISGGADSPLKVEELWSSPPDELDATLLRPDPPLNGLIAPVPVTSALPAREGVERAYIIGHPQGRKLSFSIHDNYLLDYDDRLLHYRSPTEPGSSGSPVFNADWELIGLHHRGLENMPRLNDQGGTYAANEGIWIKAIKKAL